MPSLYDQKIFTYTQEYENNYPGGSQKFTLGTHEFVEESKHRVMNEQRSVRTQSPKLASIRTKSAKQLLQPWYRVQKPSSGRSTALKKKKTKVYTHPKEFSYEENTLKHYGSNSITAVFPGDPGFTRAAVGPVGMRYSFGGFDSGRVPAYLPSDESDFNGRFGRLQNEAAAEFLNRVLDVDTSFGQMLAERKQTIDLFSDMVKNLAAGLVALKKGKLKQAYKRLVPQNRKEISNAVLANNFGLQPLLSDLDGMAKIFAQGLNLERDVKYSKSINHPFSEQIIETTQGTYRIYEEWELTYILKARLSARTGAEYLSSLGAKLGLTDIAGLAWELTPWSFVADWFTNVGDVIKSRLTPVGCNIEWVTATTFLKVRRRFVYEAHGFTNDGYKILPTMGAWVTTHVSCQRKFLPGLPTVTLQIEDDPLSVTRAINSLALASQKLRK